MNITMDVEPSVFIPPTRVIHSITIQVFNLVLFKGATIMVSFFDVDNYPIDTKTVELEGESYLQWANDDNWLVNYILERFSLTKKVS
jgi:hypothetical protein